MVYPFGKLIIAPLAASYTRSISGKQHLPPPPYLIAANHASYLDDLLIPSTFILHEDRPVHIFVNSRYYHNPLLRAFLYHYDCIPVDVSKDVQDPKRRKRTNEKAFRQALSALKKGHLFAIFPEGGRSPDGKMRKAKTGVARVALASGLPVVPVGIRGSYEVMPKGASFPRFRRAELRIGKPLSFKGSPDDRKAQEQVTRTIMKAVARLAGQRYRW